MANIFSRFTLYFHDKAMEEKFSKYNLPHQIICFKIITIGLVILITLLAIMGDKDLVNIYLRILVIIGNLAFFFALYRITTKKYPRLIEPTVLLLSSLITVIIIELTISFRPEWQISFTSGSILQIFIIFPLICRARFRIQAFFIFSLEMLPSLRFNLSRSSAVNNEIAYPFSTGILLSILLLGLLYLSERHSRRSFYEMEKYQQYLESYKDLIKDVIPNAVLILRDKQLLFHNSAAETLFSANQNNQILERLKEIWVDVAHSKEDSVPAMDEGISFSSKFIDLIEVTEERARTDSTHQFKFLSGIIRFPDKVESSQKTVDIQIGKFVWERMESWMILINDVSALKRLVQVESLSAYKDQLLATVSHDLRTPLNGIIGMIDFSQKLTENTEVLHYLEISKRSANLLLSMINDILDFSQISNGKLRLQFESFNLEELITDVINIFEFQAKSKKLELRSEIALPRERWTLYSDPNRLRQVLLNLVGNALKFTQKGIVRLSVYEAPFEGNRVVHMKVEDSGIGIAKENIQNLFHLFGKLRQSNQKLNSMGVGLGLAISQKLVRMLNESREGAEIKVISELGHGSQFYFPLLEMEIKSEQICYTAKSIEFDPAMVEDVPAKVKSIDIPNHYLPDKSKGKKKLFKTIFNSSEEDMVRLSKSKSPQILIVDDDPINVIVLRKYLSLITEPKLAVKVAHNGSEALELIAQANQSGERFVIIFMDINMPIMDGIETTLAVRHMERVSETPEKCKIIGTTANKIDMDKEKYLRLGMDNVISKPMPKEIVLQIVKNILDRV